jgi:hypothetical protein
MKLFPVKIISFGIKGILSLTTFNLVRASLTVNFRKLNKNQ